MDDKKLTRRGFVKTSGAAGFCALCTGLSDAESPVQDTEQEGEKDKVQIARDYLKWWLENLMRNFDTHEAGTDAIEIIEGCGRACAHKWVGAHFPKLKKEITDKGDLRAVVDILNKYRIGGGNLKIDGDTVIGIYTKCYCPIMEGGLITSPYFCNCTAGFSKEVFEVLMDRPFEVELVSTIGRGDKECRIEARPRKPAKGE